MLLGIDWGKIATHFLYYLMFIILNWLNHIIIISIITFFHFSLGHRLATIDDWVFENAWNISTLSKNISFIIVFKFVAVKSHRRSPFSELLGKGLVLPSRNIFMMMTLLVSFFFLFGGVNVGPSHKFELGKAISSSYGVTLFYGAEIFLIYFINAFHNIPSKVRYCLIPFYGLVFIIHNKITFFYGIGLNFFVFVNFSMLLYLLFWKRLNWSLPLLFIFFFICPLAIFMGLDPLWQGKFSYFLLKEKIEYAVYVGIFLIPSIFLAYKEYKADSDTQV